MHLKPKSKVNPKLHNHDANHCYTVSPVFAMHSNIKSVCRSRKIVYFHEPQVLAAVVAGVVVVVFMVVVDHALQLAS